MIDGVRTAVHGEDQQTQRPHSTNEVPAMNGQVLRLRPDKGFGFVKCEDGAERFFHRSRCEETAPFDQLKVGDYVKFRLEAHEKGDRCVALEYM